MNTDLIIIALTGLTLFLFSIDQFSKEIKNVLGDKFREILQKLTNNRLKGSIFGALVTALVQSSTATTVITVSLVNAGAISFLQSLPIIFGANVGTTITAQLVAFKVTKYAAYFIISGFLIRFFGRRYKYFGMPIFYFGLVFFSLDLIQDTISPIKDDPQVIMFFASLTSIPLALVAGFLFTVLVQSSSVSTGLVVLLADSGLINLPTAIILLLGANIGTTSTSYIASLNMNIFAKRTAIAHLLFNVIGALLLLPFISRFSNTIMMLGGNAAQQVANAHTIFNVSATILFLLILTQFNKIITYLVPGKEEEILFNTKYITTLPEKNIDAFTMIEKELKYSYEIIIKLYDQAFKNLKKPDEKDFQVVDKYEKLSDYLDEKIEAAILEISRRELNEEEINKTVYLVRLSNAIEQLGDLAYDISYLSKNMSESGIELSTDSEQAIKEIYNLFKENLKLVKLLEAKNIRKIKANEKALTKLINEKFKQHIAFRKSSGAYAGSIFTESVSLLAASIAKLKEVKKISQKYN